MVQLRSCYFCGATGALSEYEALPAELGVASGASPRVILCDRCHTKLRNVLAPLVDGADRGAVDASATSDVAGDRPSQPEVTFARAETPADETTDEPEVSDIDSAGSADGAGDALSDDSETDVADAVAAETGEADADTTAEEDHTDAADDESAGETADESETTDAAPPTSDLDRVYHKLLRFLRNREFPIPRTEAEAIAQSAYDLTETEASQVIQRTIDRDVLEERDGELHRR